MTKYFRLTLLFPLLFSFIYFSCAPSIMNLDDAKEAVEKYYESGVYEKEVNDVINKALNQLDKIEPSTKAVAVFDIDETSLSSYEYVKSIGFGYVPKMWSEYMFEGTQKAIPGTKKLYDRLVAKGISVIFLTGRRDIFAEASKKNLINEGYTKFDTLITRKPEDYKTSAVEFKSKTRRELTQKGFKIVMNVGDQFSDLQGGNSGIEVKLPNYLYLVP